MATEEMTEEAMKQEAFTLLAQGKRHLLVKDFSEASTCLALCCEYLARVFGETADECGDAYFAYGKALLELARTETGVLGNAIEEKDEADGDSDDEDVAAGSAGDSVTEPEGAEDKATTTEDKDDDKSESVGSSEDVEAAVATVAEAAEKEVEKTEEGKVEEGGEKTEAVAESKGENSEPAAVAGSSKENGHAETEADGEENGDGSDDDDVSNLHLAWEVLELAKNVFTRRAESGDSEHRLRLAEVQLALGEVALESENYTDATADMALCLALQRQHLEDDDRRIAETLYQMGVAYSLANSFDEAIHSFSECGHVLERRVAGLKRKMAAGDVPTGDDPFYTFQGEVEQLEKLFPEIREKIFDMQDFKQETLRVLAGGGDPGAGSSKGPGAATDRLGAGSSSANQTSPAAASTNDRPAANIGHLVRKKAKPEAETEAQPDAKRARVDEQGDK